MSSSLAFPLPSAFIPSIFDPRPRDISPDSPKSTPANDHQSSKSRNLLDRRPQNQLTKNFQFERQESAEKSAEKSAEERTGAQAQRFTEILPLPRSKSAAIALYNSNSRLELLEKPSLFRIDIYI